MIFDYQSVEQFLKDELRRRLHTNPRYTLRSFARALKVSPGALSEILRGHRQLSVRSVPQVVRAIGLNQAEAKHLLNLIYQAKAKQNPEAQTGEPPPKAQRVPEDIFNLVSEWYHFAILNLLDCDGFKWDAAWIARRLGLTRMQAQMAMELLLKLKLVEKRDGKYKGQSQVMATWADIPSAAVRSYHRQILNKAVNALENQSLTEREISGVGFAFDPAHLPKIKKDIGTFQDELLEKYSRGSKTEVYFLEMALFKLTEGDSP